MNYSYCKITWNNFSYVFLLYEGAMIVIMKELALFWLPISTQCGMYPQCGKKWPIGMQGVMMLQVRTDTIIMLQVRTDTSS